MFAMTLSTPTFAPPLLNDAWMGDETEEEHLLLLAMEMNLQREIMDHARCSPEKKQIGVERRDEDDDDDATTSGPPGLDDDEEEEEEEEEEGSEEEGDDDDF